MPELPNRLLVFFLLLFIIPLSAVSSEISGRIDHDTKWDASGSPYHVVGLVNVASGVRLYIEPGVVVQFEPDAGIVVNGYIIARGAEGDSVLFTSAVEKSPGAWGGITINGGTAVSKWFMDEDATDCESCLEYCIIEYAGSDQLTFSSALSINATSSKITNSSLRYNKSRTGTVYCGNVSSPVISDCDIVHNQASRGGGVAIGVGSKAVLRNNLIAFNHSEDTGGGVYLSLGEAQIIGNRFVGNEARGHAGAFHASVSGHLVLQDNVFAGNKSGFKSSTILFSGEVKAKLTNNVFESGSNAIYLQGTIGDILARQNWFGHPEDFNMHTYIHDRRETIDEPFVLYDPILWAPPADLVTNPSKVNAIILCRNNSFADEIPFGVADGAHLWIHLMADDTQPEIRDVIQVKVVSVKDAEGIVVPLIETAKNSGVFTGHGKVAELSDQTIYTIGDDIGGTVTIFAPFDPSVKAEYETMSPKPLVEEFTVADQASILNLTNHSPQFGWNYWEILEHPQTHYQVQVFPADVDGVPQGAPIWDTCETAANAKTVQYGGAMLEDGMNYIARIRVNSGYFWSDPLDLRFRMNSLPSAPVATYPSADELVATLKPELKVAMSSDGEMDSLTYTFELFESYNSDVVSPTSGISAKKGSVSCTAPLKLSENGCFTFRCRAVDPYEASPWGETRQFYINAKEEPAAAFDFVSPALDAEIYLLHPELIWTEAVDPDPLSSVFYTVEISKSDKFAGGKSYTDIRPTSFTVPDSLDNRTTYFWRVTSTDNTGRKTVASRVGKFRVDTTPSVPAMSAPLAGEERQPQDVLNWEACSDPNHSDLIFYDLEVYSEVGLVNKIASFEGWTETPIAVNQLKGWEKLTDNHVYFWRVRSRDNHNADSKFCSAGSFFFNRFNDNPAPISVITAPSDTVMGTHDIRFAWKESSDPDLSDPASTLVYELEAVLSPNDFASADVRRFESSPGAVELSVQLEDNRLWRYRMRVRDNESAVSTWSKVQTFLVNYAEDAPAPFALLEPTTNAAISELDSLKFSWASSSDPDWESSIVYRFELFEKDAKIHSEQTSGTSVSYKKGLTNESQYSWTVTAVDNIGMATKVSADYNFTTNTTPTAPVAVDIPVELMPAGALTFSGASDPNPVDRLTYTVELAATAGLAAPVVSVKGLKHAQGTISAVIASLAGQEGLNDDADYFFRVRATDNHGYNGAWSDPVSFRFNRQNDAPSMAMVPFAPKDSVVVRTQNPTLTWNAATDEDLTDPQNTLVYDLQMVYLGQIASKPTYTYSTASGTVSFTVPDQLRDNTLWSWQVRARDNDGAVSDWSILHSFLVNVQEDAPTAPQLTTPAAKQNFNHLGPIEFAWVASQDVDYRSSVSYSIEYATDPGFMGAKRSEGLTGTTFRVEYPVENTTYYWRVTAVDNTGLKTISAANSFVCDTRPSIPVLTFPRPAAPIPEAELLTGGSMGWNVASDPNPADKILYTVQIGTGLNKLEKNILKTQEALDALTLSTAVWADMLKDNTVYQWRVKAIDNHGIESAWSEAWSFFYNSVNNPPGFVPDIYSPASATEVSVVNISWGASRDPDISDPASRIAYIIELCKIPVFVGNIVSSQTAQGETSYSPTGLTDDARWYWRVKAVDDEGASGDFRWVHRFIYNTANDAPATTPELVQPADGVTIPMVSLSWTAASDKDLTDPPNTLTYRIDCSTQADFNGDRKSFTTPAGQTTFSPTGLTDDARWYWRVVTLDNDGAESAPSSARSFVLNTANDAPDQVKALTSPANGETVTSANLSWQAASDSDLSDTPASLSYAVELATDGNFGAGVISLSSGAGQTTLTPAGLQDNTIYFWRVRAKDSKGAAGRWSDKSSFTLNTANDAPSSFDLLSPVNGGEVSGGITLKWQASTDVDPGAKVSYTVLIARDAAFTQKATRYQAKNAMEFALPNHAIKETGAYYWKVLADDGMGGQAWSNGSWSFTIPALVAPAAGN